MVPAIQGLALDLTAVTIYDTSCTHQTGAADVYGSDTSLHLYAALGQCGSHSVLPSSLFLTDSSL